MLSRGKHKGFEDSGCLVSPGVFCPAGSHHNQSYGCADWRLSFGTEILWCAGCRSSVALTVLPDAS